LLISTSRGDEPFAVYAFMSFLIGLIYIGIVLWNRGYWYAWRQVRARRWPQVQGRFSSGEVVRLMRGQGFSIRPGPGKVAGYELRLRYEYRAGKGLSGNGLYKRAFADRQDAEAWLSRIKGQKFPVRMAIKQPSVSCLLEKDLALIINPHGLGQTTTLH
jgi:hypothetical protein